MPLTLALLSAGNAQLLTLLKALENLAQQKPGFHQERFLAALGWMFNDENPTYPLPLAEPIIEQLRAQYPCRATCDCPSCRARREPAPAGLAVCLDSFVQDLFAEMSEVAVIHNWITGHGFTPGEITPMRQYVGG